MNKKTNFGIDPAQVVTFQTQSHAAQGANPAATGRQQFSQKKCDDLIATHDAFGERMRARDSDSFLTLEGPLTPDEVGDRIIARMKVLNAKTV